MSDSPRAASPGLLADTLAIGTALTSLFAAIATFPLLTTLAAFHPEGDCDARAAEVPAVPVVEAEPHLPAEPADSEEPQIAPPARPVDVATLASVVTLDSDPHRVGIWMWAKQALQSISCKSTRLNGVP